MLSDIHYLSVFTVLDALGRQRLTEGDAPLSKNALVRRCLVEGREFMFDPGFHLQGILDDLERRGIIRVSMDERGTEICATDRIFEEILRVKEETEVAVH